MLLGGAAREPSAILPAPAPPTAPREPSGVIAMPQVAAKPKLLMGTMAVPALMEAELASIPRPPPPGPPGPTLASMKGRTMLGQMAFTPPTGGAAARMAVIGRAPGSDIVLAYPQVSTRHTGVAPTTDGMLAVTDLGSTNGTHVDGKRIPPGNPVKIKPGSRIFIGPYAINLGLENNEVRAWVDSDNADWSGNLVEIEALDLFLQVPDRENKAQNKVLLNHVTFKAHPGDLIALMGPSGAGKTTLLTVLNGYLVSAA
jgi:ABC-type multidrug transport system fused ATPase/permease subunit